MVENDVNNLVSTDDVKVKTKKKGFLDKVFNQKKVVIVAEFPDIESLNIVKSMISDKDKSLVSEYNGKKSVISKDYDEKLSLLSGDGSDYFVELKGINNNYQAEINRIEDERVKAVKKLEDSLVLKTKVLNEEKSKKILMLDNEYNDIIDKLNLLKKVFKMESE